MGNVTAERGETLDLGLTSRALADIRPGDGEAGHHAVRSSLMARLFGHSRESIGRYELHERLGQGGFGVVHSAWDPQLQRHVALKLLRTDRRAELDDDEHLLHEARVAGSLSHPNIVAVHDVGRYERAPLDAGVFLVMERVEGTTLSEWLESDRDPDAVLDAYAQAGRGLAAAHAAGLVHRDFKPANALIDETGRVRVADFGLADFTDERQDSLESTGEHSLVSDNETTQTIVGTPLYMAPEQLDGRPADAASDQYSFCLSLRQALSRQPVFTGSLVEQHAAKRHGVPPWPSTRTLSAAVRRVIDRGLHSDPIQRWPSMDALLQALDRARGSGRRVRRSAAAATVAALSLGLAAAAWPSEPPCREQTAQQQVWDSAAKERVQAAMGAVESTHADATAQRVTVGLDDLARRWADEQTAACQVAPAEPIQSPQLSCLSRVRGQIAQAVHILENADRGVIDNAAMMVAGLPAPEHCSLAVDDTQPTTPEQEELIERLERADVSVMAGRFDQASEAIAAVERRAEVLDAPVVEAAAWSARGSLLARQGHFEDAELLLRRAMERALEHDRGSIAVQTGATLSYVVGAELARPEDGLSIASITTAIGRGLGADHPALASALYSQGIVLRHAGQVETAEARHREALAMRRRLFSPEHPDVLDSMETLSAAIGSQGRLDEAMALTQEVLEIRRRIQGEDHPEVAGAEVNLGYFQAERGDFDGARVSLTHAAVTLERTLGPNHPTLGIALQNLAGVEKHAGRLDDALARLEQSLEISRRAVGEDNPDTAIVLGNIGVVLLDQGNAARAQKLLTRSLAILRAHLPARDPRLRPTLAALARAETALAHPEAAIAAWTEAIELGTEAFGSAHPKVASTQVGLAEALTAAGRQPEAADVLDAIEVPLEALDAALSERLSAVQAQVSSR